jgi:alpha-galactosidase
MKKSCEVKIAYVGGGSQGWAIKLFNDLALSDRLSGSLELYDIDRTGAELNARRAGLIFGHRDARSRFSVRVSRSLPSALKGADFVVLSILPGPMEMMANDLDIPARYGILQTVGDSTGPGGISRGLRSVPVYAEFARQIMKHCPSAWVINYTNPMTLCTAALYAAEPGIKAFGCCHEVFGTQSRLAALAERSWRVARPDRREIRTEVTGVNHFTFVLSASWKDRDLFPLVRREISRKGFFGDRTRTALARKRRKEYFSSDGLVAFDFFRNFGALGAAGDRHLAEFVPWYLADERTLHRWGVVLTPSEYRLKGYYGSRPYLSGRPVRIVPPKRLDNSGEEGVRQMCALLGLGDLTTNVNLPNRGQVPDLPPGSVVETNAIFGRDSVKPVRVRPMPPTLRSLVDRVCAVQRAVLEAGLARDNDLAFQSLLNDPLVRIPTDKARRMFDELMEANRALARSPTKAR